MAEQDHELRRINWTETFSFTQIFKSFKLAIHPSKMILALAAIIGVLIIGCVMDAIWSYAGSNARVSDVYAYYVVSSPADYDKQLDSQRESSQSTLVQAYNSSISDAQTLYPIRSRIPTGSMGSEFFSALMKDINNRPGARLDLATEQTREQAKKNPTAVWRMYKHNVNEMLSTAEGLGKNARVRAEEDIKQLTGAQRRAPMIAWPMIRPRLTGSFGRSAWNPSRTVTSSSLG